MKKIKLFSLIFSLLFCLSACHTDAPTRPTSAEKNEPTEAEENATILKKTEDRGQDYLDSFIFFGESTTYHLKSRGVLSGGRNTTQVWGADNGTAMLDRDVTTLRIRYPETDELLTVAEACARKKPTYLLLTFGLNGAPQIIQHGEQAFRANYLRLIEVVQKASPNTKIILQSCFPVAENMDMSRYSLTLDQLNEAIRQINKWTLAIAEDYDLRYLDTAEILSDKDGRLKIEYQNGDGHHLTGEAYQEILSYIRTHGYQ